MSTAPSPNRSRSLWIALALAAVVAAAVIVWFVSQSVGSDPGGAAPTPTATSASATPTPTTTPTPTATPTPDAAAEAAFLADVRPKINDIMAQTDPPITPDIVATALPDEQLLMIGKNLLVTGDAGIDAIVDATVTQIGDVVPVDILRQLFSAVLESASTHLT